MKTPILLFTDYDGTLYDSGMKIFLSRKYNVLSSKIIRERLTKFIVSTGRPTWSRISELQNQIFGMHPADTVIVGGGTYIFHRINRRLVIDEEWASLMTQSKVLWRDSKKAESWSKEVLKEKIRNVVRQWGVTYERSPNPYLLRLPLYNMNPSSLAEFTKALLDTWKSGIKIVLTEKLYRKNTPEIFNGYAMLLPENAGKDLSALFLIKKFIREENKIPECLFFGDALIDIPMLTLDLKGIASKRAFGINLTPLARKFIRDNEIQDNVVALSGHSSKSVLTVLQSLKEDLQKIEK